LLDWLPWSPFVLLAGWWFLKQGWWREDAEARFGLVWLLAMLAVLSCFRFKRADYLLMAYPGAALFLGCAAERSLQKLRRPRLAVTVFALVVGAIVLGWLIHVEWTLPRGEAAREYRKFAQEIRKLAPAPEPVLFFRTESHALAFHLGRPLTIMVWWEDLDAWLSRSGIHYVVMPSDSARERTQFLKYSRLEEVFTNSDVAGIDHEKPLVLLRAYPLTID
jgi:hypothetical protein